MPAYKVKFMHCLPDISVIGVPGRDMINVINKKAMRKIPWPNINLLYFSIYIPELFCLQNCHITFNFPESSAGLIIVFDLCKYFLCLFLLPGFHIINT